MFAVRLVGLFGVQLRTNTEHAKQFVISEHAEQLILSEQSEHRTGPKLKILKISEQGELWWTLVKSDS